MALGQTFRNLHLLCCRLAWQACGLGLCALIVALAAGAPAVTAAQSTATAAPAPTTPTAPSERTVLVLMPFQSNLPVSKLALQTLQEEFGGWVEQVQRAATAADASQLLALAAQVEATRPVMAQTLRAWVAEFDYHAIIIAVRAPANQSHADD